MNYRLGDDPSRQTIYDGATLVAVGCTPEFAAALVERMKSEPARQQDVDLLLWLLAEKDHLTDWLIRVGDTERNATNAAYDRAVEERDTALMTLAFWAVEGGDSP